MNLDDFAARLDKAHPGRDYVLGCCPFHQDEKPSLVVFESGWFMCYGKRCGVKGPWAVLWSRLMGGEELHGIRPRSPDRSDVVWDLPPLPTNVADMDTYAYKRHEMMKYMVTVEWYYKMRGVDSLIDKCNLGWDQGWYIVPICDPLGFTQGLVARAGPHVEHVTGLRFATPKGQSGMMYVPDWNLMYDSGPIAVVFGIFDALTLTMFDVPAVTPTAGKDSFKPEWLDDYRKRIIIIPDAGEDQAAWDLANDLGWRSFVYFLDYPDGCKDVNDFLRTGRVKELKRQLHKVGLL